MYFIVHAAFVRIKLMMMMMMMISTYNTVWTTTLSMWHFLLMTLSNSHSVVCFLILPS